MSPARRSARRRDWPRGLYEPRPGYFVWRNPLTGETLIIGRVPLAVARNEALDANRFVTDSRPGLVEQLSGSTKTIADLLAEIPPAKAEATRKNDTQRDKAIIARIGTRPCGQLTVADCASVVEEFVKADKARWAQALRSRMVAMCQRGMELGWMDSNPAEVTRVPEVVVKRGRLTLEMFWAIYEKAPQVTEWLQHAMMLALVTGQDRSTIANMQRAHVKDGHLIVWRGKTKKTNRPVAIPLSLRMDAAGKSLAEIVNHRTGVLSKYLVHHVEPWGNAPAGSPIHVDRFSTAFTDARRLAGIPEEGAPTFHEIRSLTKRLYDKQGGVDTKALLGHKTERMSDLYADPRGVEPIMVAVG